MIEYIIMLALVNYFNEQLITTLDNNIKNSETDFLFCKPTLRESKVSMLLPSLSILAHLSCTFKWEDLLLTDRNGLGNT